MKFLFFKKPVESEPLVLRFHGELEGSVVLHVSQFGLHRVQLGEISVCDSSMAAPQCELKWENAATKKAVPKWMDGFLDEFQAFLRGRDHSFAFVPLVSDRIMSEFALGVYEGASDIVPGETISYGELAMRLGAPLASRAVGGALGRNPWPLLVPCHRIVGSDARLVGFSATGGVETKAKLIEFERRFATAKERDHGNLAPTLHA